MTGSHKTVMKCLGLVFFLNTTLTEAQMLQDLEAVSLIKKEIDYTYNLQFKKAGEVHKQISQLYPANPIVILLKGIMTYWENYPLLKTDSDHISFEDDMRQCIIMAENNNNPSLETECLLADLCARGMLLMFYADNDLPVEVIPLATTTYRHLRRSFGFINSCKDLNYFAGLYNYYRETYPRVYPIYESLAFIFPPGDIETGLRQLQTTAINSVLLRADSYFSLTWIYLYYENNFPESTFYSKSLYELYPENSQYIALYVKSLLLIKQYDEAEMIISSSFSAGSKSYFQAQLLILKGILLEKKYQDNISAKEFYNRGILDIASFGDYGNEYSAYAYYGLSRISASDGETLTSRLFRRKAVKLADFKDIDFNN